MSDVDEFDALEAAWGLIANAYGGDWELAHPIWRDAAVRWRDQYNNYIDAKRMTRSLGDELVDGGLVDDPEEYIEDRKLREDLDGTSN